MVDSKKPRLSQDDYTKFKCVTIGESGVGKTSFVKRLLGFDFIPNQDSTLGAMFIENKLIINQDTEECVKVQFWDTAGQERYRALAPMYIRSANLAFVVCDITNRQSYINLDFWIDLVKNTSFEAEIIVIINKLDLKDIVKFPITEDDITTKLSQYNIKHYFTSAKTNKNIDIIKKIIFDLSSEKMMKEKKFKKNNLLKKIIKPSIKLDETYSINNKDSSIGESSYYFDRNRCCYG